MDFATFCTLANLFQFYFNNNARTLGQLAYKDILSAGQQLQTYALLKNYTRLFIQNNLIFESLGEGIKISKFYTFDKYGNKTLNMKSHYLKTDDYLISVNELFFDYRIFETVYSHNVNFPFQLNSTQFSEVIKDEFFKDTNDLISKSFADFKKVASAAGVQGDEKFFKNVTFKILDMNNNTYIDIYELMLANKIAKVYNIIKTGEKIKKVKDPKDLKYNQTVEDLITRTEEDNLKYINYKFNTKTINFHQFLFLYLNRLRETSYLASQDQIIPFLNYYGFYTSQDFMKKFYKEFDIKPDGFLNYLLALQKFMEFYSNTTG